MISITMNKNYKYENQYFTQMAAIHILDRYIAGRFEIEAIIKYVGNYHEKHSGVLTDSDDLERRVRNALDSLSLLGRAVEGPQDFWILPPDDQRIFGNGKNWVYLYYFEHHKRESVSQGKAVWHCKIGSTHRNPEDRIKELTRGYPTPPTISLLFRTDKHKVLEKTIHRILEFRGNRIDNAQGDEWFWTNPDRVLEIYDFVIYGDPIRTEKHRFVESRLSDSRQRKTN